MNRGRYKHACVFPANFLNDGYYSISIFLITNVTRFDVFVPMAKVILGGLLTSTLLNIFIVPIVYFLVSRNKHHLKS